MRFAFAELPGEIGAPPRPVVPVQLEDLDRAPVVCLVDTGAVASRLGRWLADAVGIDLSKAPHDRIAVGGLTTTAWHAGAELSVAGVRYEAPVTFCDPWPFAFGLLGQEGFLRYFRLTVCAKEFWLEVDPEP